MLNRNAREIIRRGRIYYIRYYDVKGRRRMETTKSTDRNEAEKMLRKRLSAKDAGVSPDVAIGKLTLKEATDDLLDDYKVNGRRSLPEVRRNVELHLLPYFGDRRRMTSITTAEMRAFIAERQREETADDGTITRAASNAEINRELAALRRVFRLAVRAGRLVQCPHAPMLQERNSRRGFWNLTRSSPSVRRCRRLYGPWSSSATQQGGGRRAKSCRSNGGMSIGPGAVSGWMRTRRSARLPVHGRPRNDPQGPACRARTAEDGRHHLPVRVPSGRRSD